MTAKQQVRSLAPALLLALLLAAVPALLEWASLPPAAHRLARAGFAETVDAAATRPVTLPHRWQADCPACTTVWYRFELPLAELPRETAAVWLPTASRNAAIYLNGRLLAQGGRFSEPAARLGARGLWATVPASQWSLGDNRLYLLVQSPQPAFGYTAAPAVASESALAWPYRLRMLWSETLPQLVAVAAGLLALVMGAIVLLRRRERAYLALAVACAAYALHGGSALMAEPPWSSLTWDRWLAFSQLASAAAVLVLFAMLARMPLALRHLASIGLLLLAGAAMLLAGDAGAALRLLPALSSLLLAGSAAALLLHAWRRSDGRLLVAALVAASSGFVDAAIPQGAPTAMPWLPWAMVVLFAVASWILLLGFVGSLDAAELLNVDLEAMVKDRTLALEQQFARVAELERRQTLAAERERLMRDMHDGVGGHLVSLLAMLESGQRRPEQLASAVREALDDMRLMIDSLEPVDDDLNAVLAMWRDRLEPRLRAAGVVLHWDVDLLRPLPGLTPARVLHVLRILQEAVSNAIRHGHARTLWLAADDHDAAVCIGVRDDGGGFDAAGATGGRGLKNMKHRAEQVGARLAITSTPGQGTRLTIEIARVAG